jgi:hypothetical protein
MTDGFRIEKLCRDHAIDDFTCGSAELDRFLIRFAFGNRPANASQTYLGLSGPTVVGFDTRAVGEVAYADANTVSVSRPPVRTGSNFSNRRDKPRLPDSPSLLRPPKTSRADGYTERTKG